MTWLGNLALVSGFIFFVTTASAQTIPVDSEPREIQTSSTVRTIINEPNYRETDLTTSAMVAPVKPAAVPFDESKMMRVGDIRPGTKGYGLTVFSGIEPERFDVDIIGVRHRMMAGTDIILCRIQSPYLQDLGVIAGMSGSPVYVDDKLIGAVAYGFLDVDDPLAGVTPIENMLAVYNSTPTTPAQQPDDSADAGGLTAFDDYMALKADPTMENLRRVAVGGAKAEPLQMRGSDFGNQFSLPSEFTLQPLSAPVVVTSENSLTEQLAQSVFPQMDVMSASQPAAAASQWSPSALALNSPGGPVENIQALSEKFSGGYAMSVPFIEGDLHMAVVGTVTWRLNDRLVGFGHPMFEKGTSYAPMAAARINALVRERVKPFKLGETVGHLGMIRQDRLPAVGGLFGQTAKMFPVAVHVNDSAYAGNREFNFRLWNDKSMTPGFVATVLGESLSAGARTGGDSAALYTYSFRLNDGTSVTAENYSSDSGGTVMAIMGAMADTGILMNNPFKRVDLEELSFNMTVTDRLRQASIESATLDKDIYHPGDTAVIEWIVHPYRQEEVRMAYEIAVPDHLPDGDYEVVISDATTRESLESRRNPGEMKIHDYEDIVRLVQRNFADNRIYVSMVDNDTGISVRGSELPKLPGSVINLIQDTANTEYLAPVRGNFVVDADIKTAYEISGKATVKLKVERK